MLQTEGGREGGALQREKVEMRAPSSFLPSFLACLVVSEEQCRQRPHGASSTCRPSLKKYHSCLPLLLLHHHRGGQEGRKEKASISSPIGAREREREID